MTEPLDKYGLDFHCTGILEEYRADRPVFEKMLAFVRGKLSESIAANNIYITALEARIKEEASLAGKLELKGHKYSSLSDITDILGARVITFYSEEVDKVSALVDNIFEIDWDNSVDKRKMHELDSFGYNSLHYICRISKSLFFDPEYPQINEYRFEIQIRTALQHVWATMNHDTGYKSGVEVPREYLRNLNRLAGMLELADEQFSIIRSEITNYRRQVQSLVNNGSFEDVSLNGDTFRSYLQLKPFEKLNKKIASINQAEIHESSAMPYLPVLTKFGFKTLADVENLKKDYGEDACQLAIFQVGNTDIDIISSTLALQNLLVVYVFENGGGEKALKEMFDMVNGVSDSNSYRAAHLVEIMDQLHLCNRKKI